MPIFTLGRLERLYEPTVGSGLICATLKLYTLSSLLPVQVQLINDAYNLVIDAMLGPEADCDEIKEPYSGILVTLKQIKTPIVSVDVPSGECFHPAGRLRGGGA